MKVRLLEDAHKTFLPKGTIGTLYTDECFCKRFIPDQPIDENYPFRPDGAYIGSKKYEEV